MTSRDLIASAYRLIGVLAEGQTLSGTKAITGLEALNQLIDTWNVDAISLFSVTTLTIPTVAGLETYTIGPTGSGVTSVRPSTLVSVAYRDTSISPPVDTPITILEAADYNLIGSKQTNSSTPFFCYYNPTFPDGTLTLYPVPNSGRQLIVQFAEPLNSNLTLNSDIALPPAYLRSLRFNLAVALSIEAGRQQVNPAVLAVAQQTKEMLDRANLRVPTLAYWGTSGDYDVETDTRGW